MSHPADKIHTIVHPEVRDYLRTLHHDDEPLLTALEVYAKERNFPLVGRESGRWLELLTRAISGRRVFEMGSGFGYSAYWFARAVGPGGSVIGTEKDAHELTAFTRIYDQHPLRQRIDLRLGNADDVLATTEGDFDVIFLDIDKQSYEPALHLAIPRLRVGGLLLADNTLWGGRTARPADDENTRALQAFNQTLCDHPQLQAMILPVGDGLGVALKLA